MGSTKGTCIDVRSNQVEHMKVGPRLMKVWLWSIRRKVGSIGVTHVQLVTCVKWDLKGDGAWHVGNKEGGRCSRVERVYKLDGTVGTQWEIKKRRNKRHV